MTTIEAPFQGGLAPPTIVRIDNGGTQTRVESVQGDIVLGSRVYETYPDYEKAIGQAAKTAIELCGGRKIDAVGFAVAGKIRKGMIADAGSLKEYGWCDKPFKEDAVQEFGLERGLVLVLNDCVAAAKAQQVVNRDADGPNSGYVATISTGFGGAGFSVSTNELIEDEPGHEYLKPGAECGCGNNGCAEAHISGSGIERKFGVPARELLDDLWRNQVVPDTVETHIALLNRLAKNGFKPEVLYYFGSVATKQPWLVMPGLKKGLEKNVARIPHLPKIELAKHGDRGGLVGAGAAALELALA